MKKVFRITILFAAMMGTLFTTGCDGGGDAAPPEVDMTTIQEAPPQPPVAPDGTDPR